MIKICFGVGRVRSLVREVPYTSRCGQNKQLQFCWYCDCYYYFFLFYFFGLSCSTQGASQLGTSGKESTCQWRKCKREGLVPVSGRSSGGGHSNTLQYSCLENPMDRGDWRATVHVGHKDLDKTEATEHAAHKIFPMSCRIFPCGTWPF